MGKICLLITVAIFFNISIAQDDDKNGFDKNRKLQDAQENEILFQLNELDDDSLNPDITLPPNNNATNDLMSVDQELMLEIDGTNQTLGSSSSETYPLDEIPDFLKTSQNQDSTQTVAPTNLVKVTNQENAEKKTSIPEIPKPNNKVKEPTDISQTLNEEPQTEEKTLVTPPIIKKAKQSSPFPPLTLKQKERLEYVKKLYRTGRFYTLYTSSFSKNEFDALYYQALACYNLTRKRKRYQGRLGETIRKAKSNIVQKAKDNLFHIGRFSPNPNLKERAVFWFAIISMNYPKKYLDEKEITDTFLYIEESMKNSYIYNDALVYLTLIYRKLGKNNKAKEYYKKALKTSPNDLVYNYKTDSLVPAKKILDLFENLK